MKTNSEIAAVFAELAERLAVVEPQPYRWMSYRKAATTIAESPVSVAKLAEQGRVRDLPGVGEAIATKIQDFLETGTFRALERARGEVPDGLLALTRVAGIGTKTAQRIWQELGASSWSDVAEAARIGRLGRLNGVGPKAVKAVLTAADATEPDQDSVSQQGDRGLLRGDAEGLAQATEHALEQGLGARLQDSFAAGELVRGVELPSCVSLVIIGDDPRDLLADATRVLREHGFNDPDGDAGVAEDPGASDIPHALMLAASGSPVVVWAADATTLPLTSLHATGPPAHAAVVRKQLAGPVAGRACPGDSWSRLRVLENEPLPDDVLYRAGGLPYVPPELRDHAWVFEDPTDPRLTTLIRESDLQADLHCHTKWSDGRASVIDMARAARDRGDSHISIADHSAPFTMVNGLDGERLREQAGEIALANRELEGEFIVLQGSEVEIQPDGTLGLPDDVLERLDWVVASLHVSQRQDAETVWRRMEPVLRNPLVDCIGHPTSRILRRRARTSLDVDRLVELAAETGTVLEINADPRRLDLDSDHAGRALAAGVRLSINSDAHGPRSLGIRSHGAAVARRAGATAVDVVNCYDVDRLQAVRPRNR